MADFHISQLETLNTPSDDDTLVINDNSASPVTKKISFKNLKLEVQSQNIGAGLEFDSQGRYTISVGSGLKFDDLTSNADLTLDIGTGLRFITGTLVLDADDASMNYVGNRLTVRLRPGGGIDVVPFNLQGAGLYVEWDRLAFVQSNVPNSLSEPTAPFEKGRLWVNTSPSIPEMKVYDGSNWKNMGISLNTFKQVVAASSSFSNFQLNVAAMTD